jgi:hypothetical protein
MLEFLNTTAIHLLRQKILPTKKTTTDSRGGLANALSAWTADGFIEPML